MGVTYIEGAVVGPKGKAELRFLVDSGATYTLLSEKVWKEIGLAPKRRVTFTLADGTAIERNVSECFIKLPQQGEGHTLVILEEPDDEALLGMVTLEILGLILNPFTRELQPMRMDAFGMMYFTGCDSERIVEAVEEDRNVQVGANKEKS